MYCEKCGVEIDCKTDVCPLCHEMINGENNEQVYPKATIKRRRLDLFSKIYIPLAAVVLTACITANILTSEKFMWSMVVMVAAVYAYYCVRFTFLAQDRFGALIFGQTIAQTAVFIAIRFIVGGNGFLFVVWLPIVYALSEILLGVYVATRPKEIKKRVSTIFIMGVLGAVPVCLAYILDLSEKLPCIISTAFSLFLALLTAIIGRKQVIEQFKKYFHR